MTRSRTLAEPLRRLRWLPAVCLLVTAACGAGGSGGDGCGEFT